jgi:hypothetical protein
LDTFTFFNGVPESIRVGILILSALWIGGLLGAVVWRIRYRGGHIVANVVAALISFAFGIVAPQLINYVGWHIGGEGGWVYNSFNSFIIFVIDATVFWVVFLAGRRAGSSMLLSLLISTFIAFRFYGMYLILALFGALIFGMPVCIIGVIGRDLLRANLPDKYFSQLCFPPRRYRKREIVDESYKTSVGHVAEW